MTDDQQTNGKVKQCLNLSVKFRKLDTEIQGMRWRSSNHPTWLAQVA